jgi:hypothetical protein
MGSYSKLRKIIHVFHLYGINLLGKRKYDNFYQDLKMDKVFVLGLIFEKELVTKNQLNDEDAYSAQVPAYIIEKLIK